MTRLEQLRADNDALLARVMGQFDAIVADIECVKHAWRSASPALFPTGDCRIGDRQRAQQEASHAAHA